MKAGLLISTRSLCPIPSMSITDFNSVTFLCNSFKVRNLPPSRPQFSADKVKYLSRRSPNHGTWSTKSSMCCFVRVASSPSIELSALDKAITDPSNAASGFMQRLVLVDLEPATAKLAIALLGPFLSAFSFLFILRIVMSWYPKLPVGKFPYVIAYAPTEPLLIPTRKVIPPLGGVDVTPVVWFGLISFLNEILVGPQGLLVLLSQQV
ncbi:hypothetical protein NMG60_11005275 [Bertholletia excelsa]